MKPPLTLHSIDRLRARYLFGCLWRMAKVARNALLILTGNVVAGGLLLSFLDDKTIFEGQYLAFITALTVGYGDLAPVSVAARVVSMFIGLILTGVMIAMIVKALELAFQEEAGQLEAFQRSEIEKNEQAAK